MMPSDDDHILKSLLVSVARRLWWRRLVRRLLAVTAGASAAASVGLILARFGVRHEPIERVVIVVTVGMALALLPVVRRVTALDAARVADGAWGLQERLTTAVACVGQPGAMSRLVVRDAARAALNLASVPLTGPRIGREAWLAGLGLAVVGLLWCSDSRGSAGAGATGAVGSPASVVEGPARPGMAGAARTDPTGMEGGALRALLSPEDHRDSRGVADVAGSTLTTRQAGPVGRESSRSSDRPQHESPARRSADGPGQSGSPGHPSATLAENVAGDRARGTLGGPAEGGGLTVGGDSGSGPGKRQSAPTDERSARAPRNTGNENPLADGIGGPGMPPRTPIPPGLRQYILRYFERLAEPGVTGPRG
jgi:hypothetical protein